MLQMELQRLVLTASMQWNEDKTLLISSLFFDKRSGKPITDDEQNNARAMTLTSRVTNRFGS